MDHINFLASLKDEVRIEESKRMIEMKQMIDTQHKIICFMADRFSWKPISEISGKNRLVLVADYSAGVFKKIALMRYIADENKLMINPTNGRLQSNFEASKDVPLSVDNLSKNIDIYFKELGHPGEEHRIEGKP